MIHISSVSFNTKQGVQSEKSIVITLTTGTALPGLEGRSYKYSAPKSNFKTIEDYRQENIGRKLPYESIEDLCVQTGMELYGHWLYNTKWLDKNPHIRKDLIAKYSEKSEAPKQEDKSDDDLPF